MAAMLEKRLFHPDVVQMQHFLLLLLQPRCRGWVQPTHLLLGEQRFPNAGWGLASPGRFPCAIWHSSTPAASTGPEQAGIGHGVKAGTP